MPTSNPCTWSKVISIVNELDPQTVLDVGCGMGTYGCLLRMGCEWRHWPPDIREDAPPEWKRTIDAVEVYAPNITPFHRLIYNDILIGDIRELATAVRGYDVIILGDVIEHLRKEEGLRVIEALVPKARQALIVVTPAGYLRQDAVDGNEAEVHRSGWLPRDFPRFGDDFLSLEGTENRVPQLVAVICGSSLLPSAKRGLAWQFSRRRQAAWDVACALLGPEWALRLLNARRERRRTSRDG